MSKFDKLNFNMFKNNHVMTESFGHFIRKKRKELGWNQTQLAFQLNIDAAKLSKIENGIFSLQEDRLQEISKMFEMNYDEVKDMFFADEIAKTIYKNQCTVDTLKLADEILTYYISTNAKQGQIEFKK